MTLGEKIKTIREQKNLSTTKLAKMAGIAQSTLRGIEIGDSNASFTSIEKISTALNITIQQLIDMNETFNDEQFQEDLNYTVSKFNATQKKLLLEFLRSMN